MKLSFTSMKKQLENPSRIKYAKIITPLAYERQELFRFGQLID